MARLTKRSYNRRLVMLGVMLFIGIGLVSTGFAAWVMSTDASKEDGGNVDVAIIEEGSLNIKLNEAGKLPAFSFDAAKGDEVGRLRGDKKNYENLSITITGSIQPATYLKHFIVKLELPAGVDKAVEKNYIQKPDCATTEGVDITSQLTDGSEGEKLFSYTISFKWGSAFSNQNPSIYYDDPLTGKGVHDDVMKSTLRDFRSLMGEVTPGPNGDGEAVQKPFTLILEAKAN